MTQMSLAKRGKITPEMKEVAIIEGVSVTKIRNGVASGKIVIPKNVVRDEIPSLGIGTGLRVKVNANIGTSPDCVNFAEEIKKAEIAVACGADTVMDLSIGGDLDKIRHKILKIPVPLGTVPIYQAATEAVRKSGTILDMREDMLLNAVEKHAKDGVDFMTIHAGITKESLKKVLHCKRLTGIVSRGGSFLAAWMMHNKKENPLYKDFNYLLEIAKEYDFTISLGDALRPGSIHDSSDAAQNKELMILGRLVKNARREDVQCIVEGPGHVPLNEIVTSVALEKKICNGAPFYVLGPLVTDIAPGYDHISGAIGGATAALAGADFLCYVTPAEHLALPTVEDVRAGVIASKIAAHAADLARGVDTDRDYQMSKARANLDWQKQFKLCIDPKRALDYRKKRLPKSREVCTMCGEFCAMRISKGYLK